MKIKEGVSLVGLNIKMRPALIEADRIWKDHGQELVVTCGPGGTHSAGSLHYYGHAVDFRTRYFNSSETRQVTARLREKLLMYDMLFQVILHSTHIHVEYNIL